MDSDFSLFHACVTLISLLFKHNIVKNPNWPGANKSAIYKPLTSMAEGLNSGGQTGTRKVLYVSLIIVYLEHGVL